MIVTRRNVSMAIIDFCNNIFEVQYIGYSNDPQDEFSPFNVEPEYLQAFIDDLEDCWISVEYTLDAVEAMEEFDV